MSNPVKDRRFGKFTVTRGIVESDDMFEIMRGVLIVRAELRYDLDAVEYVGACEHFGVVPHGVMPPEYVAEFKTSIDGDKRSIAVTWQKI